jgi:alginate O-acetyltransferase complex protein AlgI
LLLAAYYAAPARHRNAVALAASAFFYAWGAPRFVIVLFASGLVDYVLGRELPEGRRAPRARKGILALAVVLNVALLLYFKYANFFVGELNGWLARLGMDGVSWAGVALPIGISFFTFQKLSYLVDVYRGVAQPARNAGDYLLYVALFPQLIAGPIVRYHDVARQLVARDYTRERFFTGMLRFGQGLGKKVLVANTMAEVADAAFGAAPATLSFGWAWVGVLAYAFQIYFDFSGYSDMAIGLGRLLGIEFLENFNRPYISRSITEFWRRWHISLSNWMREYLYVPLGGNRKGTARTYLNLWVVFLISGFWHGAAWNFVAWGAFHGFFLCFDKLAKRSCSACSWPCRWSRWRRAGRRTIRWRAWRRRPHAQRSARGPGGTGRCRRNSTPGWASASGCAGCSCARPTSSTSRCSAPCRSAAARRCCWGATACCSRRSTWTPTTARGAGRGRNCATSARPPSACRIGWRRTASRSCW